MEIFELRYFVSIARHENLQKASRELRISPAALSRTVQRLESELGVRLFERDGRRLRITTDGEVLVRHASDILAREEAARLTLSGRSAVVRAVLAGPEALLLLAGLGVMERLDGTAALRIGLASMSDEEALARVASGEAHLAIVSCSAPAGLASVEVARASFRVCASVHHPLAERARRGDAISIDEVLAQPFVAPSLPIYGGRHEQQAADGWHDESFPRTIRYVSSCLRTMEALVASGRALAYMPVQLATTAELVPLAVDGYPHAHERVIRIAANLPVAAPWLTPLFEPR